MTYKSCEDFAGSRHHRSRNHYLWHWRRDEPACLTARRQMKRYDADRVIARMTEGKKP